MFDAILKFFGGIVKFIGFLILIILLLIVGGCTHALFGPTCIPVDQLQRSEQTQFTYTAPEVNEALQFNTTI